jgi:nuclear pore complex protein Nup98-Nup96
MSTTGGFGASTTGTGVTPFGQSSFNKPATGATGFQSAGFGNTGGSSLFGGAAPSAGTGLFGATSTPAFGQPQQQQTTTFSGFNSGASAPLFGSTSTSGFAQPKPAFGGFGTTTQSTGLFGAQATQSVASTGAPGSSMSIFSGQSSSLFGGTTGECSLRKCGLVYWIQIFKILGFV